MSDKHVLHELSAYIDGETPGAARIERHLQHCADCAKRHMQLLKMSAHLNTLRRGESQPEFIADVLTRVIEEKQKTRPQYAWPALAAAA